MHWIDPRSLPEIRGAFERFLLNSHGEADGLILSDGQEVHFPPHMAPEVVGAILDSDPVDIRIRGVRPRKGDVFAAVSLQVGDGEPIEDRGPPEKDAGPKGGKPAKIEKASRTLVGEVLRPLHGPKGERRGLLLKSGEIVRFPPHAEAKAAPFLEGGVAVAVKGKSLRTPIGEVLEATHIGAHEDDLREIEGKKKPPHD